MHVTTENTLDSNSDKLDVSDKKRQQRKETRSVITPYAFEVAPHLFGTPLASPSRRACALLIDLFLVALLSGVTGNALAISIAILFWMSSRRIARDHGHNYAVTLLKFAAGFLMLIGLLGFIFDNFNGSELQDRSQLTTVSSDDATKTEVVVEDKTQNAIKVAVLTGKYLLQGSQVQEKVDNGECVDVITCWKTMGEQFTSDLVEFELPESVEQELIASFIEFGSESISQPQLDELSKQMLSSFELKKAKVIDNTQNITDTSDQTLVEPFAAAVEESVESFKDIGPDTQQTQDSEYSLVKWVRGIIADLGLGFGWAAAYFTATMSWLKGQTIGKKLMGIKVIKLDGSALNIWEGFGRYGGYGAGLATGLMGFMQVFWDPNRQAIQDKISETLVIKIH